MRRAGRLDRAAALADEALDALARPGDLRHAGSSSMQAELVALALGIAVDGGRYEGAVSRADAALAALGAAETPDAAAAALAGARLHLEAGRVLAMQRDAAAAQVRLRAALAAPDRRTLEGEPAALVRIRAQAMLGAVLCMHGEHVEGQRVLEQALSDAASWGHDEAGSERARILLSLGASDFEQFRLDAARQWVERAFFELTPLVQAGRCGALADLGRAWHNLGSIHSRAGRLPDAIGAFEEALDVYRRALRRATQRGDMARLRASRANTTMNLGYTCFKAGDHEKAQRHLSKAMRRYGTLLGSNPHLGVDTARSAINAAHLALHRDESARAAALYRRGLETLDEVGPSRQPLEHAGDRANALLGLARAELALGRAARSAARFEQAMSLLRELTAQGRLHLAHAWLRGWTAQATVLAERTAPLRAGGRAVAALLDTLRSPPLRALGGNEEPLRVLREALAAIARWLATQNRRPRRDEAIDRLAEAGLRHLFDCSAQLLAQSSPQWLARREEPVRAWVAELGATASVHPCAPVLLARWFLSTRGLRGQRIAEAALGGARLAELGRALQQTSRIEAELLAETGPETSPFGPDILQALGADRSAPSLQAERAARWQALRALVQTHRDRAVRDGLLPAASRWEVNALSALLQERQALLLVARLDDARLVATAVRRPLDGGQPRVQCRVAELPSHLSDRSCDDFVASARRALRHDFAAAATRHIEAPRRLDLEAAARPADGDARALAALREMAACTIGPLLDALCEAETCDRIVLVPADDLHLLPWRHLLHERHPSLQVQVQPTVGAWVRCQDAAARPGGAWPRWTLAACDPHHDPLPWVAVERRLSVRLWSEVGCTPEHWGRRSDEPATHDALLVMGHGAAPRGHVALAGVALEDGSVLSAHDLGAGAGGGFEHVLLSACVSAGTRDAFGEPLGFLSSCFDYRTRFGIGWLTEVPDAAACFFSLAFQFSLRQAIAGSAAADWGEVFDATCSGLEGGSWPRGFAAWMKAERLVEGAELAQAPPPALVRVLPWVVAMGR